MSLKYGTLDYMWVEQNYEKKVSTRMTIIKSPHWRLVAVT